MFDELKISEIRLICELSRNKSLRHVARKFDETPQNMSKIIKSIESKIKSQLIHRSPSGYTPTHECLLLSEKLDTWLLNLNEFEMFEKSNRVQKKIYTICARVFVNFCLAPNIVSDFNQIYPYIDFQFVDGSPKKKEEWARSGLLDLIISIGKLDLPKNWIGELVGEISSNFYVRKNHPLGTRCKLNELQKYPLLMHSHIDENHIELSQSLSKEKLKPKIRGTSSETNLSSLLIAAKTQQVAFVPDIIFKYLSLDYQLQKLDVVDFKKTDSQMFLYAQSDNVENSHFVRIKSKIIESLQI